MPPGAESTFAFSLRCESVDEAGAYDCSSWRYSSRKSVIDILVVAVTVSFCDPAMARLCIFLGLIIEKILTLFKISGFNY